MFGMFDRIKNSRLPDGTPCPINIDIYGYFMSAATIIAQAPYFGLGMGRRRIAEDTTMMIHYGSSGFYGHSKDFERWADESKRVCARMEAIYLELIRKKQPKFKKKDLEALMGYDCFLTAEQVIDLNFADEIIEASNKS